MLRRYAQAIPFHWQMEVASLQHGTYTTICVMTAQDTDRPHACSACHQSTPPARLCMSTYMMLKCTICVTAMHAAHDAHPRKCEQTRPVECLVQGNRRTRSLPAPAGGRSCSRSWCRWRTPSTACAQGGADSGRPRGSSPRSCAPGRPLWCCRTPGRCTGCCSWCRRPGAAYIPPPQRTWRTSPCD